MSGSATEMIKITLPVLACLMLVACNTPPKVDPLAGGGGLSGSWVSTDGVFTAELSNGRFTSRANDTGEVLSQGSYVVASAEQVQLRWRSQARNEDSLANCTREGVEVLNCTDQAGRPFSLRKVSI